MKKFVLVLVCTLIITIFIAFNYLLWDRENKIRSYEDLNTSKNMSIDALGDKIKSLNDANKQLTEKQKSLEDENRQIRNTLELVNEELSKTISTLKQKNDTINQLKKQMDIKPFENSIKKWVESIDNGEYQKAYALQEKQLKNPDNNVSLDQFAQIYKNNVKSIKLKSIKLYEDEVSEDRQGELIFVVSMEIKRPEGNNGDKLFVDGENERYFTLEFDKQQEQWIIANISDVP